MISAGLLIASLGFSWCLLHIMAAAHHPTGGELSFIGGVTAIAGGLLLALAGVVHWALS